MSVCTNEEQQRDDLTRQCCVDFEWRRVHFERRPVVAVGEFGDFSNQYVDGDGDIDFDSLTPEKQEWVDYYRQEDSRYKEDYSRVCLLLHLLEFES
ncbi:MAG: hypothetical protein M1812_001475 [Candelaria pacifica]|nr:MAG: hypothetical protein M1812_001475 [Candelaria pacifica]